MAQIPRPRTYHCHLSISQSALSSFQAPRLPNSILCSAPDPSHRQPPSPKHSLALAPNCHRSSILKSPFAFRRRRFTIQIPATSLGTSLNILRLSTIMSLMTNYRVAPFGMFMQDPRERTEQLHEIWGTFNTPSPHTSTSTAPSAYRDSSPSSPSSSTSPTLDSQSRHDSISNRVSKAWRSIRIRTRSFARPKAF